MTIFVGAFCFIAGALLSAIIASVLDADDDYLGGNE